jgi:hypothetical protein
MVQKTFFKHAFSYAPVQGLPQRHQGTKKTPGKSLCEPSCLGAFVATRKSTGVSLFLSQVKIKFNAF